MRPARRPAPRRQDGPGRRRASWKRPASSTASSAPSTLFRRLSGTEAARACLGFIKHIDEPTFRISGWSCQGDNLPARRAAIGCMLNRLILLTAGNDPKLAELFAHAELRRSDCATSGAPALSADWLMGADNPRLRGAL